jgi:hypothetical protein
MNVTEIKTVVNEGTLYRGNLMPAFCDIERAIGTRILECGAIDGIKRIVAQWRDRRFKVTEIATGVGLVAEEDLDDLADGLLDDTDIQYAVQWAVQHRELQGALVVTRTAEGLVVDLQ